MVSPPTADCKAAVSSAALLTMMALPEVEENVAVTLLAADRVVVQAPVPVQAPLQLEKVWPAAATALNVTTAPLG